MKKSIVISLVVLFSLLGACVPKNADLDDAGVKLSQTELHFGSGESTEMVTVSTTQSGWSAVCPKEGEWVELNQSGNKLEVKVLANEWGEARETSITVIAGGAASKIRIEQSAADIVLEAIPPSITLSPEGGEKSIDIRSNTENWTASLNPAVDWLSVRAKPTASMIVLEATENTTAEDRTVKLVARSGSKVIEIPIVQKARAKYTIPLMITHVREIEELVKEETLRGSVLSKFTGIGGFGENIVPGEISFAPQATNITAVGYTYRPNDKIGGYDIVAHSMIGIDYNTFRSEEYKTFMQEHGFLAEFSTENILSYVNKERVLEAQIYKTNTGIAKMNFRSYIIQEEEYPTLSTLPVDLHLKSLNKKQFKYADILSLEASMGSQLLEEVHDTFYPDEVKRLFFSATQPENCINRSYALYNSADNPDAPIAWIGTAKQINSKFNNAHLGAWQRPNGEWVITREMYKLLSENDFLFRRKIVRDKQTWFQYYREKDDLSLAVIPEKEDDNTSALYIITAVLGFDFTEKEVSPSRSQLGAEQFSLFLPLR